MESSLKLKLKSMPKSIPNLSKEEFNRALKQVPTTVVEVIVKGERGVLLGKRNTEPFKGLWQLTGGFVYYNEKIGAAVGRVGKREIGAEVEIVKPLGIYEYIRDDPRGHIIAHAFIAKIADGKNLNPSHSGALTPDALKFAPNPDNSDLQFFKAPPDDMIPYQKKIVEDALKN